MQEKLSYLRTFLGVDMVDTYNELCNLEPDEYRQYGNYYPEKIKDYNVVTKCLDQMDRWGANRWWLSQDERELAYYQVMSDELIIPFPVFHDSLESLIGRTIPEMVTRYHPKSLRDAAKKAFYN